MSAGRGLRIMGKPMFQSPSFFLGRNDSKRLRSLANLAIDENLFLFGYGIEGDK